MEVTKANIDDLLKTSEGRAIVLAAHYKNQASITASNTGLAPEQILAIVETLVVTGLVKEPGVAMDTLVKLCSVKRKTRLDLLRDKLVLQLWKDGNLDIARANELLNIQPEGGNDGQVNT